MFFVEYHDVVAHRALLLIPYLATAAGHQAVIIFFVLSGFLISGSIFRAIDKKAWSWRQYLTHRVVRLWLVLLPALVLGVFWDSLNIYASHHLPHYGGAVISGLVPEGIAHWISLPILLGNAFFTQQILVHTLGSNGPLWSLTNEFWYYLLFPLVLFCLRRYYRPSLRVVSFLVFAAGAWFVGKDILLMFPIWIAGALLHFVPRYCFQAYFRYAASVVYAGIFLACVPLARIHPLLSDYCLAIATAVLFWILLSAVERSSGRLNERLARGTARFSYTLYLVHVPLLMFLASFFIHETLLPPTLPLFFKALLLWCTAVLYAVLIASVTEFRIETVRPWVERRMDRLFGARS